MNTNKLRGEIIAHGYTIKEFSGLVGIKHSALYRKLNGTTEFDRAELKRIIEVLSLSAEQVSAIFFS